MGDGPTAGQLIMGTINIGLTLAVTYYVGKWLAKILDPTSKEKEEAKRQANKIISSLGLSELELSDYETSIAALLVDPLALPVSWSDIGGLDHVITEIKESVILPFRRRALFQASSLLSAPKGVLLYGPPGCGKTMIAKSTAKEAGCRFINLEVASLTDKWYGESQKLVNAVFSLATKIQPCIIFIDEIDSFLRARNSQDHEATAMMKAQFMSLWDGLMTESNSDIVIMAATNRPRDIDAAILRRLPCRFYIGPPDTTARLCIFQKIMSKEIIAPDLNLAELSSLTEGYTGSDIQELCRLAAMQCVRRQVKDVSTEVDGGSGVEEEEFFTDCLSESEDEEREEELHPIAREDFQISLERMHANNMILDKDVAMNFLS